LNMVYTSSHLLFVANLLHMIFVNFRRKLNHMLLNFNVQHSPAFSCHNLIFFLCWYELHEKSYWLFVALSYMFLFNSCYLGISLCQHCAFIVCDSELIKMYAWIKYQIFFVTQIREMEINVKQQEKFALQASLHLEHCK